MPPWGRKITGTGGCGHRSSSRNKLMCLDVVLDCPGLCLATESERVEYFTKTLSVPLEDLPSKQFSVPNVSRFDDPAIRR